MYSMHVCISCVNDVSVSVLYIGYSVYVSVMYCVCLLYTVCVSYVQCVSVVYIMYLVCMCLLYTVYVIYYVSCVLCVYQRWSEYNTNVLEYEYDYFEHA